MPETIEINDYLSVEIEGILGIRSVTVFGDTYRFSPYNGVLQAFVEGQWRDARIPENIVNPWVNYDLDLHVAKFERASWAAMPPVRFAQAILQGMINPLEVKLDEVRTEGHTPQPRLYLFEKHETGPGRKILICCLHRYSVFYPDGSFGFAFFDSGWRRFEPR